MTSTFTTSSTFTRTHAEYLASKVAADLSALYSYYGRPSRSKISDFYQELVELLSGGYVESIEYGFRRDGRRVFSMSYRVRKDGSMEDQNSGGVPPRMDIGGAEWFSYLTYSENWQFLRPDQQSQINARLAIKRTPGPEPQDGDGAWEVSKSYSAGGVSTQRRIFRPSGGRA